MTELTIQTDIEIILRELAQAFQEVREHIEALPETSYLSRPDGRWSPAENLEHLLLSTFPVAAALRKEPAFFDQFGSPQLSEIADYAGLKARYKSILQTGLKAPARFVPEDAKVYQKAQHLEQWDAVGEKLQDATGKWSERDLNEKAMMHPALGVISVRQMLYFTILHTYHHLEAM